MAGGSAQTASWLGAWGHVGPWLEENVATFPAGGGRGSRNEAGALVSPQYAEAAVHVGTHARAGGGTGDVRSVFGRAESRRCAPAGLTTAPNGHTERATDAHFSNPPPPPPPPTPTHNQQPTFTCRLLAP